MTIGKGLCNITNILDNLLECMPPGLAPKQTAHDKELGKFRYYIKVGISVHRYFVDCIYVVVGFYSSFSIVNI